MHKQTHSPIRAQQENEVIMVLRILQALFYTVKVQSTYQLEDTCMLEVLFTLIKQASPYELSQ